MEASPSQKEPSNKDRRRHVIGWFVAMIAVTAGSAAVVMARTHSVSVESARLNALAEAGPHVLVTHPQAASAERRLTLPATIQGYEETPVFAKIAGYLKAIRVDKGDRVKKGEVIAILESPELDQQVADAKDTRTRTARRATRVMSRRSNSRCPTTRPNSSRRRRARMSAGAATAIPAGRSRADGRAGTEPFSCRANWWMRRYRHRDAVHRRRLKRIVTDTCMSCWGIPAGKGGKVAPRSISSTD